MEMADGLLLNKKVCCYSRDGQGGIELTMEEMHSVEFVREVHIIGSNP